MKKILSFFAAMLVAVAVFADTDFAAPGYACAADDAVLANVYGLSLNTDAETHYIQCAEATYNVTLATWTVTATRGCYVSVALDLGPAYGSNKHIFRVTIKDAKGNVKGYLAESAENNTADEVKELDGTILLPAEGEYTVELESNRQYGKGTIENIILTYTADAPSEMIAVESIELNKDELPLEIDEVELLVATVLPEDAFDPSVTWESSDEDVATVSESGLVTAIAEGNATITAKAGEKTATCAVTVTAASVPDVDFAEPYVLAGKVAHLEGNIAKNDDYDIYYLNKSTQGEATWTINVTKACYVTATINNDAANTSGHCFAVEIFDAEDKSVGSVAEPANSWSHKSDVLSGKILIPAVGEYTIKLSNTCQWSSAILNSVTLTFDSDLPQVLYLKISDDWSWPAKYAIYYFNDEKNGWSDFMTAVEGEENTYVGSIPAEFADANIIFVRFSSEKEAVGDWNDKWSQTVDLTIPEGKDFFTVTSGGTGDQCNGEWSKYDEGGDEPEEIKYYLVGEFNDWAAADEYLFVASESEDGQFELEIALEIDDEFKVVSSKNVWFPGDGKDNYKVDVNHAGDKTVLFRPDGEGGEGWYEGVIYVEANGPEPKFYISGSMTNWEASISSTEDSYTFENLEAGNYSFKVIDDENQWFGYTQLTAASKAVELYPDQDDNVCFTLAEAGDVVVTYIKDEEFKVEGNFVLPTITLPGIPDWENYPALVPAANKLSASVTVSLAGYHTYEFKVICGATWLGKDKDGDNKYELKRDWPTVSELTYTGDNMKLIADKDGDYTFTWTFATRELVVTFPDFDHENGFYLAGKFSGEEKWSADAITDDMMFEWYKKTGIEENDEWILSTTVAEGDEFKACYIYNDGITDANWFPGGDAANYVVDAAHAGKVTIYLRPAGDGGDDWHAYTLYVEKDKPTAIENSEAAVKTQKMIENGQLIIIRGGEKFNAQGQMIR